MKSDMENLSDNESEDMLDTLESNNNNNNNGTRKLSPRPVMRTTYRKFSIPGLGLSQLQSNIQLGLPNARRRLSNVSDVVSRKLSSTIGWRTASAQDIGNQAKSLCSQYIRSKLKRCGVFNRKLGLQRLRSLANIPGGQIVCDVFPELHAIGVELERMHPKLYNSVCRQVCVTLTSEKVVRTVLVTIAQELFKSDVTWAKIVSLYAIAGGLSADCIRQGHPEYLYALVETMGSYVERDLSGWIAYQGGWIALLNKYKAPNIEHSQLPSLVLAVTVIFLVLALIIFFIRSIGRKLSELVT